jgi:hypothetical protein
LTASSALAQVRTLEAGNCAEGSRLQVDGEPRLGQSIMLRGSGCRDRVSPFLLLGVETDAPTWLPAELRCSAVGRCALVVDPVRIELDLRHLEITLPLDPHILGLTFAVQAGCFDRAAVCMDPGAAALISIRG